ncbi:MAG: tRNA 2-selenouridine(34) synthase MnmH [Chlamydiota bacterium]
MLKPLTLSKFMAAPGTIFDVRSPTEYQHAHIPGARSLPLFSDEERTEIGTLYKQIGQQTAISRGLEIIASKAESLVEEAFRQAHQQPLKIYCWRGGMRSGFITMLFKTLNHSAYQLEGGYKTFRHWVLKTLQQPRRVNILGGYSGSGKTAILKALQDRGQQILDLEALANHRGSSFGRFGQQPQPYNEHFENKIALRWGSFDPKRPVWIEDESRMIGRCKIPDALFMMMQSAPLYFLERPLQERIAHIHQLYGHIPADDLVEATMRIKKRLGGLRTQEACQAFREGPFEKAVELILQYYDKTYRHCLSNRASKVTTFPLDNLPPIESAQKLLSRHL